jgi:hypothetical protein
MTGRLAPPNVTWPYGGIFLMGDRAAAYVYLSKWRETNPNRKLVIFENLNLPGAAFAKHLPATWFASGIADEVWFADVGEIHEPEGEPIYTESMWKFWYDLRKTEYPKQSMSIKPEESAFRSIKEVIKHYNIPEQFATIQPLFDATYNTYRNASPKWWKSLCEQCQDIPLVIIGNYANSGMMPSPRRCYPLWCLDLTPMESLALIHLAKIHIGGQTGTSIWAGVMGKPLVAVYEDVFVDNWDTRPIGFNNSEVLFVDLGGPSNKVSCQIKDFWLNQG